MKRVLILALLILILVCSCTRLTEGTIISKEYRPARTWVSYIYVNKTLIPQTNYSPERYVITIQDFVDGKEVENTKTIPSYLYEKVSVGDWWTDELLD